MTTSGLVRMCGVAVVCLVSLASAEARSADIEGTYDCLGDAGNGQQYKGTVEIKALGDAYAVRWTLDSGQEYGAIGLLDDDVLAVSFFTPDGGDYGVVLYRLGSKGKLSGNWTSVGLKGAVLTETLTPKSSSRAAPREPDPDAPSPRNPLKD